MANTDKIISNISYTKKDFGSLYEETVDLARELTSKWDPATSNESDPGVVLLKEGAFIADHNNYNIDKNILEAFLPSATQDRSVRDIVETNGYVPRYYVSANGQATLTWTYKEDSEEVNSDFVIPAFTLVLTDADQTISYTQTSDIVILGSGIAASGDFIEGTIQDLTVSGSNVITTSNLDSNNRIYLPTDVVATNGIYIRYNSDTDHDKYGYWTNNNYLMTQPNGSRIYKIDYDSYKGLPYIEFPSDISNIINDGLKVSYVVTSGESGNISASTLVNIASPSEFTDKAGNTRSCDNFTVINSGAIVNGKDPETIDEMYKSFKKVVGTFDTLVTCKDYSNRIYTLAENSAYGISNAYVTDRRTDYNKALNVITTDLNGAYFKNISIKPCTLNFEGVKESLPTDADPGDMCVLSGNNKLYVNKSLSLTPNWVEADNINLTDFAILTKAMTPYDLAVYALKWFSISDYSATTPNSALSKSFKPASSTTAIKYALEDDKCISHTFNDPDGKDIYCFKNYCPVKATVTPYNKVTINERNEILNNVYIALSLNFNPRKVDFGYALDKESIRNVIENADDRIKEVDVEDLTYTTVALYIDGSEKLLNTKLNDESNITILTDVIAKNVLAGRVCLFEFDDDFTYRYGQKGIKVGDDDLTFIRNVKSLSTALELSLTPGSTDSAQVESTEATLNTYTFTGTYESEERDHVILSYIFNAPNFSLGETRKNLGIGDSYTLKGEDYFMLKVTKKTADKKETLISSNTYKSRTGVTYTLYNKISYTDSDLPLINENSDYKPIARLGDIIVEETNENSTTTTDAVNLDYTLKENEYVQIMNPNYYTDSTFGLYVNVRYEDTLSRVIPANVEYVLKSGQRIIILYTNDGVTSTKILTPGTSIKSSFNLTPTDNLKSGGAYKEWTDANGSYHESDKFITLTSNQTVETRKIMTTVLDSSNILCYWITNNQVENRLFAKGSKEKILGNNEYFVYTNTNFNEIMILGSGTKLERDDLIDDDTRWLIASNDITIEAISEAGVNANINWKAIDFSVYNLNFTEMTIVTLGENDKITISGWTGVEAGDVLGNNWIDCDGNIVYTLNGESQTLPKIENFYKIRTRLDFVASPETYFTIKQSDGSYQYIEATNVSGGIKKLDVDGARLQASQYLNLLGGLNIDLSYYNGDLSLYYYKTEKIVNFYTSDSGTTILEDIDEGDSEYLINLNKKINGHSIFPFYYNVGDKDNKRQFILPVFLSGADVPVIARLYKSFEYNKEAKTITLKDEVNIGDYNTSNFAKGLEMKETNHYLLTTNESTSEQLYLDLSWEAMPSDAELILVNSINVIKGINPDLKNTEGSGDEDLKNILDRITAIIKESSNPSVKPYYIYVPDNEMAIEKPDFSDPNVFWDKNNVANHMTIPQLEIVINKETGSTNYYIDIAKAMRGY